MVSTFKSGHVAKRACREGSHIGFFGSPYTLAFASSADSAATDTQWYAKNGHRRWSASLTLWEA